MLAHAHACSADCKGRPRQNLSGGFGRQVRKGTRDDNTAEYPRALQSTTEYPGAQCGTHHGKGPNRALPKLRVSAVWYCVKVANESLPARPAPFGVIDARAQHASGVVAGFHAAAADRFVEACGQLGGPALRGRCSVMPGQVSSVSISVSAHPTSPSADVIGRVRPSGGGDVRADFL